MSLVIKTVDSHLGKVQVICGEDGKPIADHLSTDVHYAIDEISTITVTLRIDGEKLKLDG